MNDLRVAVVGCGNWGRHIVRDLVGLECEVVAVAPSSVSRTHAVDNGARRIVERIEDLPQVDGIVIATPTITHGPVCEALLDRQVPLFVEKPLTADVASAARIVEAAGDRVFVMHKWRYHPGVELLAEIADGGELGTVVGMDLVQVGWGNPHADVDTVWILAPHCLSIALGVLGAIPPARAAVAQPGRGPDFAAGMHAILAADGGPWVSMEVSATAPEYRREFRLVCEGGAASLTGGYAEHVAIHRFDDARQAGNRPAPAPELRQISGQLPLLRELEEFVGHLRGGPPPRCSAAEGLEVVRAVDELRRRAGLDTATPP